MGKSFKLWILAFAIAGFTFMAYSQGPVQGPPQPTTAADPRKGPCGKLDPTKPGQGIPPPVGLCLPINDYLLPLLLSGIALGSFMIWRLEKST